MKWLSSIVSVNDTFCCSVDIVHFTIKIHMTSPTVIDRNDSKQMIFRSWEAENWQHIACYLSESCHVVLQFAFSGCISVFGVTVQCASDILDCVVCLALQSQRWIECIACEIQNGVIQKYNVLFFRCDVHHWEMKWMIRELTMTFSSHWNSSFPFRIVTISM